MASTLLFPPLLAAILGACVGSFLNVVAWRLPRQESLIHPGSHCPRCGTGLRWRENVPVLGWLLVGGRCRHCGASIAVRYPLVELLTAGLWVAACLARPTAMGSAAEPLLLVLAGWLLLSWLVPLTLIDLDSLWLPESLCRLGLLLGLACTAGIGLLQGTAIAAALLFQHLLAAGVGLVGFETMSALAERLMGRPALGLGDAKLAALLGAWLGLTGLGLAVALAVLSGAVIGLAGRLSGRLGPGQPFPFGPFLASGGAAVWLLGNGFWLSRLVPQI
ncbi:MAG: prepilin peptidase [Chitinophagaceae bacterium]|nr:prepilin peptidase [Chitinophagaceae bacterium]